ncbi:NACHT domain-containing protein [Streptomyces sp. NPDC006798]|uniref:NACHT domain-containing protein n=1 Tax=Streptomyces sp. NPDC006798 TaxID=3155462 RepID=UPI0033E803CB
MADTGRAEAADGATAVTGYRGPAPGDPRWPGTVRVSGTGEAIAGDGSTAVSGTYHQVNIETLTVQYGAGEPGRPVTPPWVGSWPLAPGPPPPSGDIADAAESLAREIGYRWRREEEHRRVHDPFPLPVRYGPAPADLMDRPENIQRLRPGVPPGDLSLDGELSGILDTYRSIPSRRLVVLGRAGSGKSVLAIRFVLGLLADTASAHRVPVIFSIGSWDPTTTALRDLLIDRLLRDHPHLARRAPDGRTSAARLVDAELILPVLDGFDELAEALREPALRALNATSAAMVLTSRRDEYARAVGKARTPLVWAACIELTDLAVDDLAAYLPRTDRSAARSGTSGDARVWDAVLDRLRARDTPASTRVGGVLGVPLMVALARTVYSDAPGRDPSELFDDARFPTERHLEEHLLAAFVPTVYRHRAHEQAGPDRERRNRDPDRALRWLGYLASGLTHDGHLRQDLAWWRLVECVRLSTRLLHTAIIAALCVFTATCVVGSVGTFGRGAGFDPGARLLVQAALAGLLAGVAFGLVHCALALTGRSAALPARVRLGLSATVRRGGRAPAREVLTRAGAGLLGGAVLGIGYSGADLLVRALDGNFPDAGLLRIVTGNMLFFGLIFGLTFSCAFGLLTLLEAPMNTASAVAPVQLLSVNRETAIRQFFVLAPAITLGCTFGGYLSLHLVQRLVSWNFIWPPHVALQLGAIGGLGGSAAAVLAFTAWGQWLTLARFWLPLTNRLPWDVVAFLEDAYDRGVLRHAGAVYQFRHVRLQRQLAGSYGDARRERPTTDEPSEAAAADPRDPDGGPR